MPSEAPRGWPCHNFHPASVSTAQTPTKTQPKTLNQTVPSPSNGPLKDRNPNGVIGSSPFRAR